MVAWVEEKVELAAVPGSLGSPKSNLGTIVKDSWSTVLKRESWDSVLKGQLGDIGDTTSLLGAVLNLTILGFAVYGVVTLVRKR